MQVKFGKLGLCECIPPERKTALENAVRPLKPLFDFLEEQGVDVQMTRPTADKFEMLAQKPSQRAIAKAEKPAFVSSMELAVAALSTGLSAYQQAVENQRKTTLDQMDRQLREIFRIANGWQAR